MGLFAASYGAATASCGRDTPMVKYALALMSAGLSIVVGTVWLWLSHTGELKNLFG
jgi:hypothetical protein